MGSESRYFSNTVILMFIGFIPGLYVLMTFLLASMNSEIPSKIIACTHTFTEGYGCEWSNIQTMTVELIIALPIAGTFAFYLFKKERFENKPLEKKVNTLADSTRDLLTAITDLKDIIARDEIFRNERRRQNRRRVADVLISIVSHANKILEYEKTWNGPICDKIELTTLIEEEIKEIKKLVKNTLQNSKIIISDDFLLHEIENFNIIYDLCEKSEHSWIEFKRPHDFLGSTLNCDDVRILVSICSPLVKDYEKELEKNKL